MSLPGPRAGLPGRAPEDPRGQLGRPRTSPAPMAHEGGRGPHSPRSQLTLSPWGPPRTHAISNPEGGLISSQPRRKESPTPEGDLGLSQGCVPVPHTRSQVLLWSFLWAQLHRRVCPRVLPEGVAADPGFPGCQGPEPPMTLSCPWAPGGSPEAAVAGHLQGSSGPGWAGAWSSPDEISGSGPCRQMGRKGGRRAGRRGGEGGSWAWEPGQGGLSARALPLRPDPQAWTVPSSLALLSFSQVPGTAPGSGGWAGATPVTGGSAFYP